MLGAAIRPVRARQPAVLRAPPQALFPVVKDIGVNWSSKFLISAKSMSSWSVRNLVKLAKDGRWTDNNSIIVRNSDMWILRQSINLAHPIYWSTLTSIISHCHADWSDNGECLLRVNIPWASRTPFFWVYPISVGIQRTTKTPLLILREINAPPPI